MTNAVNGEGTPTPLSPLHIDLSELRRGVDNYHIDVRLSPKFSKDVRQLADKLLQQVIAASPHAKEDTLFNAIRASYLDVMTGLIHRVKTDLNVEGVKLLEFALSKFILSTSKHLLDETIDSLKEASNESQERSSANALNTNQRLFWLQRNYDAILSRVNGQIFAQIERVESRQLHDVRAHHLPTQDHKTSDLYAPPLLFTSDLSSSAFLIDHYRLWGGDSEDAGFNLLNNDIEQKLSDLLPELSTTPFFVHENGNPEIHDDLGGLFQTQKFMGMAVDTKTQLTESFSWLDSPENLALLFDIERQQENLADIKKAEGLMAWWKARKNCRHHSKALSNITSYLQKKQLFTLLIASKHVKKLWINALAEQIEGKILCQYLSGQIDIKKLQSRSLSGKPFTDAQLKQFQASIAEIKQEAGARKLESTLGILQDISRFRRDLKYFRLNHRAFNRLRILRKENELTLSKEAGTLYNLLTANEQVDDVDRIVHHAILKADVRGSTTVTEELQNKDLNPASYFSLRFFSPINQLLPLYGANKVFIEGDAVILSLLEHEKSPQQWFAVARACGLAKAILNVVHSNNRHSEKMGLPKLEVGIGLCYAETTPLYLYDEDKPIMISPAIGMADRLSSSTWKLRKLIEGGVFNVEVFALAKGENGRGEKGQNTIRYNVNGILLDALGFAKLQTEITLKRLSVKINGEQVILHIGTYPDTSGKSNDLVIREAQVRLWQNEAPVEGHQSDDRFYEVVTNRKLISQLTSLKG
ncbi:MAG: hypothetical protein ACSHXZ_04920 [Gammaproteobacteria bacterium]